LVRLGGLLEPLARDDSPFDGRQPPGRATHFVEPELVCEAEFTEWTRQGVLRHPTYRGLRDDKGAAEVVRERAEPQGAEPRSPAALTVERLVADGEPVRGGVEVEVEGRRLKLTNLDKTLYPDAGLTKRDVIDYYLAIAPPLVAQLAGHPLTLKRYPDGV